MPPASSVLLQPLHVGDKVLPRLPARRLVRPPNELLLHSLTRSRLNPPLLPDLVAIDRDTAVVPRPAVALGVTTLFHELQVIEGLRLRFLRLGLQLHSHAVLLRWWLWCCTRWQGLF